MTGKILIDRAVVEQTLEALENAWLDASMGKGDVARHTKAINALRVALAEQPAELEPNEVKQIAEALRLADHLERFRSFPDDLAAAAELRRLHAENEALRYEVDAIADIKEERDALQASLVETRKLLEPTVNAAVMWLSLLCEAAGLDPDETTVEFSDREGNLPPITVSVAGTIATLKDRLK